MKLQALGIDLAKNVFHLVGLDANGQVVIRKRCSRSQVLAFTANLQVHVIGMEACSGAHFLGRALREQGHEVRLMPAQYVKPYVQTNKSDYIDAEAIGEAVQRPRMRFVPIKTEEQLDLQALHRVRERWVMGRTAVVNQIRSLLLERGLTLAKGRRHLEQALPRILEDAELKLRVFRDARRDTKGKPSNALSPTRLSDWRGLAVHKVEIRRAPVRKWIGPPEKRCVRAPQTVRVLLPRSRKDSK